LEKLKIRFIYVKGILLFLSFGLLVSVITIYINYNMQYKEIEKKVNDISSNNEKIIKSKIKKYFFKVEDSLNAIKTNKLFINYLNKPSNISKDTSVQLFINSMKNNSNFFQLRFIDKKGMEKIRIDRDRNSKKIFIIDEDKLQNKSKRYYFTETLNSESDSFWHSRLDLNVENGKIEKPLRPTYRISTKVFLNGELSGILIVNIDMRDILIDIKNNTNFNVYLFDNDGYFILNPDSKKDWGRYLKNEYTVFSEFPNISKEKIDSNDFALYGSLYPLEEYFKNGENIKLGLKIKDEFIQGIEDQNLMFAYTLGLVILLISVPIGFLISIPASRLYMNFNKLYQDNKTYLDTINKYVNTMSVSINKTITDISEAACKRSGYKKEELIGKKPSIFKSGRMEPKVYDELWTKINNGMVWSGELENRTKDGKRYWINATILPNINEENKIESYTSIAEDITDKKIIEKISKTDKLTNVYNRVKIDECLESELDRFLRYKHVFSVILIDIDFFKSVNDDYGHQVGDCVLVDFAKILRETSRKTDVVGRWGGEEFMLICVDTEIEGAVKQAQHIRKAIEGHKFEVVGKKTASFGVSQIQESDDIESLLKRVDDHLYKAKNNGRNNVVADEF